MQGVLKTERRPAKKSTPGQPLVSVITVCLNSERYLEQTIQSVLNQTYDNTEYIIIDGGSSDDTVKIIKKYEDRIDYWSSEKDEGVFDALNKGHHIAQGDYVLCLNAGDYLYDACAIERIIILGLENGEKPLLIAGQVMFAAGDTLLDFVWPTSQRVIDRYTAVAHQAVLVNASIYKNVYYNPHFKMAGDTEYWLRLKRKGLFQVKFVPLIISVYRVGGISNIREYDWRIELEIAHYLNFKQFRLMRLLKKLVCVFLKKLLIAIMGERIYYKYIHRSRMLCRKKYYPPNRD